MVHKAGPLNFGKNRLLATVALGVVAVVCGSTVAPGLGAQSPPAQVEPSLAFEVASIKPNKTEGRNSTITDGAGGA